MAISSDCPERLWPPALATTATLCPVHPAPGRIDHDAIGMIESRDEDLHLLPADCGDPDRVINAVGPVEMGLRIATRVVGCEHEDCEK